MPIKSSAITPEPLPEASFYIPATEPTTRLRRTMKRDDCFLVFDKPQRHRCFAGRAGRPVQLRYPLSLAFRAADQRLQPLLLGSNLSDDNCALGVDLTNPDIYYDKRFILQKDLLHVARTVFVWRSTLFHRFAVRNFSANRVMLLQRRCRMRADEERSVRATHPAGDDVTDESVFAVMAALGGFGYSVGWGVAGVSGTFGGPQDAATGSLTYATAAG